MNSAAPGRRVGEIAVDELFDTFGGDGEQSGIQNDKSGVGAEMGCGFRWANAAGVLHEELAGDAAKEGGVLGEGRERKEQEETERTEKGEWNWAKGRNIEHRTSNIEP